MLSVQNKNKFKYVDRYDGLEYVFEPHSTTIIEEQAAAHFFGYGLDDKARVSAMSRAGWLKSMAKDGPGGQDEAYAILHNFVFKEVAPDWKEVKGEVTQMERAAG